MTWLDDLTAHAASQLDHRVRDALAMRGVSDEQIELFRIGYIDRGFPPGLPPEFQRWVEGHRIEDVYVFPLTNTLCDVRGFQFRYVERDRSGYMDYIIDDGQPVLFGLGQAMPTLWRTGMAFFVEGVFDFFPIQRAFSGTLTTLTARVPETLVPTLGRLVRDIWLGYDMDTAGRRGAANFIKDHGEGFTVHKVDYPTPIMPSGKKAKDPGDLWEAWGDEKVGALVRSLMGQNTL
jgi:DNA primase